MLGRILDWLALGSDISAEIIVLSHTGLGGLVARNPAGSPPGWLAGQAHPAKVVLLQLGNFLASGGSGSSLVADLKTGASRAYGTLSVSESGLIVDLHATVASSTYYSVATTSIGWVAQISEASLGLQSMALLNDYGLLPAWQLSPAVRFRFP